MPEWSHGGGNRHEHLDDGSVRFWDGSKWWLRTADGDVYFSGDTSGAWSQAYPEPVGGMQAADLHVDEGPAKKELPETSEEIRAPSAIVATDIRNAGGVWMLAGIVVMAVVAYYALARWIAYDYVILWIGGYLLGAGAFANGLLRYRKGRRRGAASSSLWNVTLSIAAILVGVITAVAAAQWMDPAGWASVPNSQSADSVLHSCVTAPDSATIAHRVSCESREAVYFVSAVRPRQADCPRGSVNVVRREAGGVLCLFPLTKSG